MLFLRAVNKEPNGRNLMNNKTRYILIAGITLASIIGVWLLPPIPQDPAYHDFAVPLQVAGIPNFWNVVSNVPFVIVGVAGLLAVFYRLTCRGTKGRIVDLMYAVFFAGVLLTALGSSYYHWQPSNQSLVWDRLPMTLSFMSLFCMVVYHFESPRVATTLFVPLLVIGVWSVMYWSSSEASGTGDLRPYALVQFLPLIVLPFIIYGRNAPDLPRRYLWMALGWYAVAKLLEGLDGWIANALVVIGGHPFKHVFAAFATACIVTVYARSIGRIKG